MNGDFVYHLALKFAPTYKASSGEECSLVELEHEEECRIFKKYHASDPFVYFSALQLNPREGLVAYEINYFTIWDRDSGGILGPWFGHQWDTERTALLAIGPEDESDLNAFYAREAYYAAHEGMIVDKSRFLECTSKDCGVMVYWSEGKHANYPDIPQKFALFEMFRPPGFESKPREYALFDAGTLEDPKVPWLCNDEPWGPDEVGSVCTRLKTRLWDRETWEKVDRMQCTEEDIKQFQDYEGLPVTGDVDTATINASLEVDITLILYIKHFSKEEYFLLRQSGIKGDDIDLIARAGLSTSEIREITQKNLQGSELREYLHLI